MDKTRSGRVIKKSSKMEENGNGLDDSIGDNFENDAEFGDDYVDPMTEAITRPSRKRKANLVPRKEINSTNEEDITQSNSASVENNNKKLVVRKDNRTAQFYKAMRNMINSDDFSYPTLRFQSNVVPDNPYMEIVNLNRNDCGEFKFDANEHTVIISTEKTNEKLKEILGVDVDYEELSKVNKLTTYYMFTLTTKRKMESMDASFDKSQLTKDLAISWQKMPERTRRDWEIKTSRVKRQIDEQTKREKTEATTNRQKHQENSEKAKEIIEKNKLPDYDKTDVSGYLQALGSGMTNLASNLHENPNSQVDNTQTVSQVMDYLLSSMVTLVALFEEHEGLDREVSTDSLNKLTYILPK